MTKGILILPGTPRSNRKKSVQFSSGVLLIGKSEVVDLQAPASTNEALTFDYNPPVAATTHLKGGRQGTMRVKAPGVGKKGGRASVMSLYAAPVKEKEPTVIEGNLKLLKESGGKATWQKRYITLTNTHISYYRTKEADKPLKSLEIKEDCYVKEISSRTGVADCRCCLEVFYDRKKSIVLKGSTPRESTEWITSICTVIDALIGDKEEEEFEFFDESDEGSMEFFDADEAPHVNRTALEDIPFGGNPLDDQAANYSDDSFEWVDEEDVQESTARQAKEQARKQEEEKEATRRKEEAAKEEKEKEQREEKERNEVEKRRKEEEKREKERKAREQRIKPKQSAAPAQSTTHSVRPARKLSKIEALMKRFEA